jgi:hydroxymethylglutaryl-CoA reductase
MPWPTVSVVHSKASGTSAKKTSGGFSYLATGDGVIRTLLCQFENETKLKIHNYINKPCTALK